MGPAIEELVARVQIAVMVPGVRRAFEGLFRSAYAGDLAPFKALANSFKDNEEYILTSLGARNSEGGKSGHHIKDWVAGETPLHHAISEGRFPTIVFLLENGADSNARTKKRRTSLHYAAEHGSKELMQLLISKGAEINVVAADYGTPSQYAAGKGKVAFVKLLLDHHADPNLISHDLFSPLLASIQAQSLECMELLLKAGADPNIFGSKGMTPLGYAASEGLKEFIKCLLNAGADTNVANSLGMRPIEEAALRNKRRVVRILFPLTSPIPAVCDWSISGLLKQVHSDEAREEREQKMKDLFLISKLMGAESFNRKDYFGAVQWYTEAISCNPNDAGVLSERSLAWAKMTEGGLALEDAEACIKLRANRSEAYYRAGAARMLLKEFEKAAGAFYSGWMLDPENKAPEHAYREANKAQINQKSFEV